MLLTHRDTRSSEVKLVRTDPHSSRDVKASAATQAAAAGPVAALAGMPLAALLLPVGVGAAVGVLGGLIGLGGAEFRLPLLIALFGFAALHAVILNKAMSLIVVASALLFREATVPWSALAEHWTVIVNLLGGSVVGAWVGAGWATRLGGRRLSQVLAVLLVVIATVLVAGHADGGAQAALLSGGWQLLAGLLAGFAIGVVASLMGVAGGELLIPTLVVLYGADIRLAGSLSLAISLPTMLIGFLRYSRDDAFSVLRANRAFAVLMAAGSIAGTAIGGALLGVAPEWVLLPTLAALLLLSAVKLWRHA